MTHGTPELDADAAQLLAMGQDPGPEIEDLLPPCGLALPCARADCPGTFELCHGPISHGFGFYEWCPICNTVVSKIQEDDGSNASRDQA